LQPKIDHNANERFKAWVKGKHPILALLTAQLASSADFVPDLLRTLSQGTKELEKFRPLPPAERWLEFYRDHHATARLYFELLFPVGGNGAAIYDALMSLDAIARMTARASPSEKDEVKQYLSTDEGQAYVRAMTDILNGLMHLSWLEVLRKDHQSSDHENTVFDWAKQKGLLQFLLCVWFPCFVLANDYPTRLLRRARCGDIEALEHLLRIDKTVLQDRRIAEQIRDAWMTPRRARFKRLAAAVAGKPKQMNAKAAKMRMAALSSKFFQVINPVDSPAIREVFDIVKSIETGKPKSVDPDLPESPEAMSKGVQRLRKAWARIVPTRPDTK
jgi:hypothetical protein